MSETKRFTFEQAEAPDIEEHPAARHPRFDEFRRMAEEAGEWSNRRASIELEGVPDDAPCSPAALAALASEGVQIDSMTVGELRAIIALGTRGQVARVLNVLLLLDAAGLLPRPQRGDDLIRRLQ